MQKSEFEILQSEYYFTLKLKRDRTRKREQLQARTALIVAVSKYLRVTEVASLMEMHHANIGHHKEKHKFNYISWPGYAEKYDIASSMCSYMFEFKTEQARIRSVEREIERLKRVKRMLTKQIKNKLKAINNEQLQIQNNQHTRKAVC